MVLTNTYSLSPNAFLYHADAREALRCLPADSIDSCVTDPPYALVSIVKRFGGANAAPAKGNDAYMRASAGFMGKTWDTGECAMDPAFWAEVLRVLKPGAHLAAFGASRGYHRMACAIEDAGFEVRDSLMWVYGTGFPKSHDVSKGIDNLDAAQARLDRAFRFTEWVRSTGLVASRINAITGTEMGNHYTTHPTQPTVATRDLFEMLRPHFACAVPQWVEAMVDERTVESENFKRREVVGKGTAKLAQGQFNADSMGSGGYGYSDDYDLTRAHTDAAREWEGWGTALKPSHEPITVATKPITMQHHFAILLDYLTDLLEEQTIWSGLSVRVAETNFSVIRAKLDAVIKHTVLDSAKMRVLARFDPARFADQNSIFRDQGFCVATKTKGDSVQSSAKLTRSAASYLALTTPHGPADDLSTRIAAMCMSVITAGISENTVSSWVEVSDAILNRANTFTIETASRLTIVLRTWNSLTSPNIIDGTGSLSPEVAPIVLARKPLSEGTVAANVIKWRTGALNIDGCRIHTDGSEAKAYTVKRLKPGATLVAEGGTWKREGDDAEIYEGQTKAGRWPANVVHDGSDEVVGAFPSAGGQQGRAKVGGDKAGSIYGKFSSNVTTNPEPRNDSGSAARFFYSAKASKADRAGSKHPTVKPVALMEWLSTLVTPPGGTVLDPFAGSGTTGAACRNKGFNAVLIEREDEYVQDILARFALEKAA